MNHDQPTIIGIAGASGAGNSRLATQLFSKVRSLRSDNDVAILHEDNYYRDQSELSFAEREQINYDHPAALEHTLMARHLAQLRQGHSVPMPTYDYSKHTRKDTSEPFAPAKIMIVEGILILHDPQIRSLIDLKIFVDVPLDICLIRRITRDTEKRGRSLDSVMTQYQETVRPMYFKFIQPTKTYADIIIPRGGENHSALEVLCNHLDQLLS